jgi:hypothetical protein
MRSASSNSPLFHCVLCHTLRVDLSVSCSQGHAVIRRNIDLQFIVFLVPKYVTINSNVRHPLCVLYDSKGLGMLTLTVEHNYI